MKKLLLATAVAALSVSAANAAPTVYGKAFVTADYVNAEIDATYVDPSNFSSSSSYDENTVEINSHASRLGFKGSEAITANTDLVYQLEYGLRVDGDDRTFQSRDTFLGLANKDFGQVRVGRNTSVLDYVNNVTVTQGYWDNLGSNTLNTENAELDVDGNGNITGDTGSLVQALNMVSDKRQNNSIVWIAPKYNDLPVELAVQYSADESFDSNDNGFGASLMFDAGTGITAGVAYTKDMDAKTKWTPFDEELSYGGDVIRGTVTADLARYVSYPVMVGALYQVADYDIEGSEKEKGLVVSAEMGLTNFAKPAAVYLQYNKTDNLAGLDNFDSDQVVLGGKYMFRNNMIAHAYIGQNSADVNVRDLFVDGDAADLDFDVFALGGGLEYIF